jgi:hypothetical protein
VLPRVVSIEFQGRHLGTDDGLRAVSNLRALTSLSILSLRRVLIKVTQPAVAADCVRLTANGGWAGVVGNLMLVGTSYWDVRTVARDNSRRTQTPDGLLDSRSRQSS